MNDAHTKGEVADNILMCNKASVASSPLHVTAISNAMSTASLQASSPTSITPATSVATHSLNNPSSLHSSDTLKLAAMHRSSRRSRNISQLPESTHDLLPPPPLYSASDQHHDLQFERKSNAQTALVSINTMHDSWNTSMSSLVNSSFLSSANSSALVTNPPIVNTSQRQEHSTRTKKNLHDNIDWSTLNNYSIEEREEPPFPNFPVPEGDDSSASAPLDDSDYSHVRRRSDFEIDVNFDEHQEEKASSPGADECNPAELPPPHKKNRRGSLRLGTEDSSYEPTNPLLPTNDAPATPASCSSDTAFDIYVSNNAYTSSRVGSNFDVDINLTQSRNQEKLSSTSRRNSLKLEDLEDEQPSRPVQDKHGIEDSQRELVRRKVQRLLLIRHCTKCSVRSIPLPSNVQAAVTGYFCPVTSHCAEGKALCAHIKTCKLDDCTYKKCLTTRDVLGHYRHCRDIECMICGPVRSRDKRRRNQMKDDIEWRHANMLL
mmetsp:Transcript_10748/g.16205  ORF Transcript_10748/g.16205 Transcript_10748/m.16205 type:complete len:489 (+) Transcript_10748:94-1560(+)|eukprot:scaffold7667_cov161-Skeletonema_dohrnii-CCMP3373.AAC.5